MLKKTINNAHVFSLPTFAAFRTRQKVPPTQRKARRDELLLLGLGQTKRPSSKKYNKANSIDQSGELYLMISVQKKWLERCAHLIFHFLYGACRRANTRRGQPRPFQTFENPTIRIKFTTRTSWRLQVDIGKSILSRVLVPHITA